MKRAKKSIAPVDKSVDTVDRSKAALDQHLVAVDEAVNMSHPDLAEDGRADLIRVDQESAVAHAQSQGYDTRIGEYGSVVGSRLRGGNVDVPKMSDFLMIDTTMDPQKVFDLIKNEVFGNYDARSDQGRAEFGVIVFRHLNGLALPGTALPAGQSGVAASMATAQAKPMVVVKLDMGPFVHYDSTSVAMTEAVVRRVGRRAWRCAWALDKAWSWVEAWRVDSSGRGKLTETIDGPANSEVTRRASERWNINVRAAFDELMRVAQWEALRQWLIDRRRPIPFTAFTSLLTGKLLIQHGDQDWIEPKWKELFPDRAPEDGPLHLHAYFEENRGSLAKAMDLARPQQLPGKDKTGPV